MSRSIEKSATRLARERDYPESNDIEGVDGDIESSQPPINDEEMDEAQATADEFLSSLVESELRRDLDLVLEAEEGEWLTLRGVHVMIGADGLILKGPADFVGKHPNDLNDVSAKVEEPVQKPTLLDKLKGAAQSKIGDIKKLWASISTKEGRAQLVSNVKHAIKQEASQTRTLASTALKMARGQAVSAADKEVAVEQLKDIATLALLLTIKGTIASSAVGAIGKSALFKGATSKILMKKVVTKATKKGLMKVLGRKGTLPSSFDEHHEAAGQMTPEEYVEQIVLGILDEIDLDTIESED